MFYSRHSSFCLSCVFSEQKHEKRNTAFASAQPLNHFCLPLDDDAEVTKSVLSWPKLLISVFFARVNCANLMTCKYFWLLLFMLVLKSEILNSIHSQICLWKHLGKNGYQNAGVGNRKLRNSVARSPTPPPRHSCADAAAQLAGWLFYSPQSQSRVFEFKITSFYLKGRACLLTKISFRYLVFNIPPNFWKDCSPAALKGELPLVVDVCVYRYTSTTERNSDIPRDIWNGHKNFKRSNWYRKQIIQ
jgi:hypothetical protein